ncbi:MAG: T9SS type A sorting domain-containing protein [bacterium]
MLDVRDTNYQKLESIGDEIFIKIAYPSESSLLQSYPNPANNSCYIPFTLAKDSNVSLEVYNILGQRIRTINIGFKKKGSYTKQDSAILWDLKNDTGIKASKGLYFYKLTGDDFSAIKSMVVK